MTNIDYPLQLQIHEDMIFVYLKMLKCNSRIENGILSEKLHQLTVAPGAGPRHMAIKVNGSWMRLLKNQLNQLFFIKMYEI